MEFFKGTVKRLARIKTGIKIHECYSKVGGFATHKAIAKINDAMLIDQIKKSKTILLKHKIIELFHVYA
jgi:hypothetical protein